MHAHQKNRLFEQSRNQNDHRNGSPRQSRPPQLDKESRARQFNFQKLVANDPFAMGIKLGLPIERIEEYTSGAAPITSETAMFIEDTLELPPCSLDTGNFTVVSPAQIMKLVVPYKIEDAESHNDPINPEAKGEKDIMIQSANSSKIEKITAPVVAQPQSSEIITKTLPIATSERATRKSKKDDPQIPVRLANLELLIANGRGVKAQLCRRVQRADNLYYLLRHNGVIFDRKLATKIEEAVGLPEGWMEIPQKSVIEAKADWFLVATETKQTEPMTLATVPAIKKSQKIKLETARVVSPVTTPIPPIQTTASSEPNLMLLSIEKLGPIGKATIQVLNEVIEDGRLNESLALKLLKNITKEPLRT